MNIAHIKAHEGKNYNVTIFLRSGHKFYGEVTKVDNSTITICSGPSLGGILNTVDAEEVVAISEPRRS